MTALVLGGGVGGLAAANRLRKLLPSRHRVVLVDRERSMLFQPSLLWLAVGDRAPGDIQRSLRSLARTGVEVLIGPIERLDTATRTVSVGGQEIRGDAIIVALGADLAPEIIPGLAEADHNMYTLAGASAFERALRAFTGGRIVLLTATPAYKCPAAPYEAAMLVEAALRRLGTRAHAQLDLYAAEPGPMIVTGPVLSGQVRAMVESKGIGYYPEHQVTSVDPLSRRLTFANGATADFDLLLYVPPHRAPAVVREAGLLAASGWIAADRNTFETAVSGIWAIGDVVSIPLTLGKPLPKAGVFAQAQAEVVAGNIARAWTGRGTRRTFDGMGKCFLEVGDGKAGYGAGNFYGEPAPQVTLHAPTRPLHWGRVLLERQWLRRWI
ncbi:MAG: NAD(P)/FAD-dependent oxidoreductase [Gemmatimonadaceae bacterium]